MPRASSKRILIVDDDPALRMLLRKRLTSRSFQVLEAEDGPSGFALAEKKKPDLILLDILMPGEDGTLTYNALKENSKTRAIPVVFLTAVAQGYTRVREDGKGGRYFMLGKPFSPEKLLRIIRQALAEAAPPTRG